MSIAAAFDRDARDYDRLRPVLIPCFADFYGVAVSLLDFPFDAPIRVLDLGAGTGLLSMFVADAFPNARLTLVDVADEMLAKARERFDAMGRKVEVMTADYADADLGQGWDAIVSALSIHHLEHDGKRRLFARVAGALRPGGVFVNAEQVLGETAFVEAGNAAWWHREIRRLGASEADVAAALKRMEFDIMAPVADQLAWMAEAGLADAACHYRHHRFAVMAARAGLSDASMEN
ncbi:MAG TPA: class I SAM-dependent methyltransferase [Candidatus Omnitrophota bacterium]|nr:class I SAM-dependent methyltransferase [Candidatus Omnitrophota bacterium]